MPIFDSSHCGSMGEDDTGQYNTPQDIPFRNWPKSYSFTFCTLFTYHVHIKLVVNVWNYTHYSYIFYIMLDTFIEISGRSKLSVAALMLASAAPVSSAYLWLTCLLFLFNVSHSVFQGTCTSERLWCIPAGPVSRRVRRHSDGPAAELVTMATAAYLLRWSLA